jgi:hypothetical protein
MATKTAAKIEDVIRLESGTGKAYVALKDGKAHSLKALITALHKAGSPHAWGVIYRIGRLVAKHTGRQIVIDRENDRVQFVSKPTKASKSSKKVTKAAPAKVAVAA